MKMSHQVKKHSLKNTQVLLWNLITAPESVEKQVGKSNIDLPIVDSARLSAIERLDIYANMYFFRIKDAIKEDFPGLYAVLGEKHFHNLVTDYLVSHPSRHYSLRYVAQYLPKFIKTHKLNKKIKFLADMACFEWALLNVFDAADNHILGFDDLKSIPPEKWDKLYIKTIDAFELLILDYNVWEFDRFKLASSKNSNPSKIKNQKIMVWRKAGEILHRVVTSKEWGLLQKATHGVMFGDICKLTASNKRIKNTAAIVAGYFQGWIKDGILKIKG